MTRSLIEATLERSNLLDAWERVRANQGRGGVDGVTLARFATGVNRELEELANSVRQGRYRPRPLFHTQLRRKDKKPRDLGIPTVRDRVLQTAVARVLTPIFEAEFAGCSFAYRPGRSVRQALARVKRAYAEGYRYVVDADITKFFDHIDHTLLLSRVIRLVRDPTICDLVQTWVRAEVAHPNDTYSMVKGVPQGAPISPMLANLYLDQFDDALLAQHFRLVRFADDFLVLCSSREEAAHAMELTENILDGLLLKLNPEKTRIATFEEGFRFLGVTFVRDLVLTEEKAYLAADPWLEDLVPDMAIDEPGTEPEPAAPNTPIIATPASPVEIEGANAETETEPTANEHNSAPTSATSNSDPLLRTLYVMTHGATLQRSGEQMIVSKGGETLVAIPGEKVDQVLVFGHANITTPFMEYCLERKVSIVLLSGRGRFFGMVDAFDTSHLDLQRRQFSCADDSAFCLALAKQIVRGKVANQRMILKRYARTRGNTRVSEIGEELAVLGRNAQLSTNLDQLRGYEGQSAKRYFAALGELVGPAWNFTSRVRQPPTDPVNAMLSYGYTLLMYNVASLLKARGFNIMLGFFHAARAGHAALASDLMEEFRPIVVDAVVLGMVARGQVKPSDFSISPTNGGCLLSDDARKRFVQAFEAKMNSPIVHPATGSRIDYRRCIAAQVRLLDDYVLERRETYEAMVVR